MVRMFTRGAALVCAVTVGLMFFARTAAAVDAPKWVAALYVEAQRSVGLRWMPVPGAIGYKVLRSEKAGADYKEISTSPQPQYFDKEVEPGTTYFYVLQTVAGAETSANSGEKTVAIPGQKQKKLLPPEWSKDPVLNESTEFGKIGFKVGLFWNKNADAIAYNVYKSLTPGKDYALLVSGSDPQAIDSAVEPGKTYYYVLTALDSSFQETGYSAEKKIEVKAQVREQVRKKVKLVVAGRATKKLWAKAKGDDNGKFTFWEPSDIVVDEANDIVYANSNNTSEVFGLQITSGDVVYRIGGQGKDLGQFLDPLGLGLDSEGRLYVTDRQKKTIQIFSDGKFVKELPLVMPESAQVAGDVVPMDVLVDPKSGEIYVSDFATKRIHVLDGNGKFQRFIGEAGSEVGKITSPLYLDFDKDGNILVLDMGATRVMTYSKDGKFLRSWGERKPAVGAFIFIGGFAVDKDGNILVVDKSSATAQGFLPDGRYLFHLGNEKGDGGIEIFSPKTLAIDSKNRVFFAEGLVDRIQAFQITGPMPAPQEEAAENPAP